MPASTWIQRRRRLDHSLTTGGIVSSSPESVRVRNCANRWQTMVLAGTCQLKNKSLPANRDSRLIEAMMGAERCVHPQERSGPGARLTDSDFLSKVNKLGREAGNNPWLATAHFLRLPRLGGRTIVRTSASGADYPGSSPGLPANS